MQRELPAAADAAPRYRVLVEDPMWRWIYLNIAAATERVSRFVGLLQRGRISIYLLYSFLTLVAMLFLTQS
jgi:hydrogenase-4 component B